MERPLDLLYSPLQARIVLRSFHRHHLRNIPAKAKRYTTRPYLSRVRIVVSSPGEVFSLTEGLLMGDPYTESSSARKPFTIQYIPGIIHIPWNSNSIRKRAIRISKSTESTSMKRNLCGMIRNRMEIRGRTTDEPRFLVIARIEGKHWSGVITYRGNGVRIISVRRSRKEEIDLYEG